MNHRPSPNCDARTRAVDLVVLHYTDMTSAEAAVSWLTNPVSQVSAHYLVAADGTLVAMVPEARRAWHAGISLWQGIADTNGRSIGIELDSPGHANGTAPDFPEPQIAALLRLLETIRSRWPVPDAGVVAHSDVAPWRKKDPGERFPWPRLAAAGHGVWAEPALKPFHGAAFRAALKGIGYGAPESQATVDAFHRHHLPARLGQPADATSFGTACAVRDAALRTA